MDHDDTAASLQMDLDWAILVHGATSHEAWVAEQEARRYFNPPENQNEEHRNSIRQG